MEEEQQYNRKDGQGHAREYAGSKVIPLPATSMWGVARLYAYGTRAELRRNAWTKENKDNLTLFFLIEGAMGGAAYFLLPGDAQQAAYVPLADLGVRFLQGIIKSVHNHSACRKVTIDKHLLDSFQENPGIAGIVRDLYKNITS